MSRPLRVAYLVSRFPKLSETFVLYEMIELERLGVDVSLFPLIHEREPSVQPGAEPFVERMQVIRPWSRAALAAQWYWARRRPRRLAEAWVGALTGNLRSPKFLSRAVLVVPSAAAMARRIEALEVDHVHAHWATHPALAAWVVGRLTGRTYSFTAHAHDIYVDRTMLGEKVARAAFVVTISESNRRRFHEWYGRTADRVEVIHCGVDPSVFAPRQAPGGPSATGPLRIAMVATLQRQKGHAVLIDAIARLTERGVPVHARLVGDGEERPALEAAIAAADLSRVIELVGRQPRGEVAAIVGEADVVVQPSIVLESGKTEGIPVALMEAMASGVPVVATSVSGVPELVEDGVTGRLVPPGDAGALADALQAVRHDPDATARMAVAGRRRVLDEFDLEHNTRRLAERFVATARAAGREVADLPAAPAQDGSTAA
jgi:glycosyltransferase involved in cell wall biosynthesis